MKKLLILLVVLLGAQFVMFAQTPQEKMLKSNVDRYLAKVEQNTTLTPAEREKVYEIKAEHTTSIWAMDKELEGNPEGLTERKKDINRTFTQSLVAAFGRDRGIEIAKAARDQK